MTWCFHGRRSVQLSSLIVFLSILFISGLARASETSDSKPQSKSSSAAGLTAAIVLVGVAAVIGFCVFLYKLWQKKKREEQHARLLKLFEDDDELEVELGIRD